MRYLTESMKQLTMPSLFHAPDMWSSRTAEPYMPLTVHYITEDWELTSKCLQVAFTPEDHTGENMMVALANALQE